MPSMADITVQNAAAADVVYDAAMPSAGDSSPARWTQNAASGNVGFRPKLDVRTEFNGPKTVRRMVGSFEFPKTYTDSATSLEKLLASAKFNFTCNLPVVMDSDDWNEAFVQFGNLLASTLLREVSETGYAPT